MNGGDEDDVAALIACRRRHRRGCSRTRGLFMRCAQALSLARRPRGTRGRSAAQNIGSAEHSGILKGVMAAVHIVNQNRIPIPGQSLGREPRWARCEKPHRPVVGVFTRGAFAMKHALPRGTAARLPASARE